MICVVVSDTHGYKVALPDGDALIHCGDMSTDGSAQAIDRALFWMSRQMHRYKVCIAGNHDWEFELAPENARSLVPRGVTYLENSGCVIAGLHFWGSPYTPAFCNFAFNEERGAIGKHWQLIPDNVDVLMTHGPPRGVRDLVEGAGHEGCEQLRQRLVALSPRAHLCGHLHSGHGYDYLGETLVVNASICDERCRPTNKPIVIEVLPGQRAKFIPY